MLLKKNNSHHVYTVYLRVNYAQQALPIGSSISYTYFLPSGPLVGCGWWYNGRFLCVIRPSIKI
jgi:hypothetical protein